MSPQEKRAPPYLPPAPAAQSATEMTNAELTDAVLQLQQHARAQQVWIELAGHAINDHANQLETASQGFSEVKNASAELKSDTVEALASAQGNITKVFTRLDEILARCKQETWPSPHSSRAGRPHWRLSYKSW